MNEKIEIQGKTVQDAVAEALLRLGARRDEVVVKILEEPKSGFLGLLGGRPAKVEVEKKQKSRARRSGTRRPDAEGHSLSEEPQGGSRRGSRGGRGGSRRGRRPAARRDGDEPQKKENRAASPKNEDARRESGVKRDQSRRNNPRNEKPRTEGNGRNRRPRAVAKTDHAYEAPASPGQASEPQNRGDRSPRNPRNRRGSRPRKTRSEPSPAKTPAAAPAPNEQEAPRMENKPVEKSISAAMVREGLRGVSYAAPTRGVAAEEVKDTLEKMAGGMLLRAGFPCRCQVSDGEYLQVRVVTDDASAGMLIGRHGSAVDSVEHLVERMISTAAGDRVKMNLDINNYRRRRQDTLADRVYDAIGRVKETGRDYHMEPMNARERRLVHLQVAEFDGLTTVTVIDDGAKHVVISRGEGAATGDTPGAVTAEGPADESQPAD